jgi:uncharacterized SAM-binding protein YcdF (DUF218 family)
MSMFLIVLLVVATVLTGVRWRRTFRVLLVVTALMALAIGCGVVPRQMLQNLQAGYPDELTQAWRPRAAIVVLGGGIQQTPDTHQLQVGPFVYSRIVKGLELYRQCKHAGGACVVILSGGDPEKLGNSEARVYAELLQRLGADSADIVVEGNSMNTWQNAQFCAAWLAAHPQDQVVLVSSGLHVRRGVLYFSHFGVHAAGVRADYEKAPLLPVPLALNFLLTDLALHEYAGLVRYHVYQYMGWNVQAQRPGAL